jgi:predicted nucleotidyltransferase component of viral defense system
MPVEKRVVEYVARELGTEEAFVEKDWHGVQVIAAIAGFAFEGFHLVFTGGTALCKAHRLIHRFSEDIDFRLHPIGHVPNRIALSKFRNRFIASLQAAGFNID